MERRKLTESEINDILDFIVPHQGVPYDSAMSVVNINKQKLKTQLINQLIYPNQIQKLKTQIEQMYIKSKAEPGLSVGILCAQSIGERQTQLTLNSIDWSETILYNKDNKPNIEPIGQMIDNLLEKGEKIIHIEENRTEYLELEAGYYIPSCDENGDVDWHKIEAVTRHLPVGKLVQVKTKSGRTVVATQSKSFLVWDGKQFKPTKGSDVKVGDIVPVTKNLPTFKNTQTHFDIFPERTVSLDNNFGFLIGIYLAQGWYNLSFAGINATNPVIIKRITDWCDIYGITHETYMDYKTHSPMYLKIHSDVFKFIFIDSYIKSVPFFAYTAPIEFIKGLIDGYYSGIGNIDGSILISSSKSIIHGISFLLSYFDIYGDIHENYISELKISDIFAEKFIKEFSLTDSDKQNSLNSIKFCKKIEENFPLRDVYFDSVISVDFVDGTTEYVYDLTVETTRNFQLFNGLNVRDTFHKTGLTDKAVVSGVPRFSELLNATKHPKNVSCFVHFIKNNSSIAELRNLIGNSIVGMTFNKIAKSIEAIENKSEESWYKSFKILNDDRFSNHTHCISIKLKMEILFEYKLDMKTIAKKIESEYGDLFCVYSPQMIGQFDIFVDTDSITLPEDRILYVDQDNAKLIYLEEVVIPMITEMNLCGIEGIETIFYCQNSKPGQESTWMLETDGGSLIKLLCQPDVDKINTSTNNVWDIYSVLGIEAAYQFLVEEFMGIMEDIAVRHVQLLVEWMTFNGSINSISRYAMRTEDVGPISRSSFEESFDNFIKAGSFGLEESTKGVSASIICGKLAGMGTGLCKLKIDVSKLPQSKNIFKLDKIPEHETKSETKSEPKSETKQKRFELPKKKVIEPFIKI